MKYIEKRKDEYLEPVAKKAIDACVKAKCSLRMIIDSFRTDKRPKLENSLMPGIRS